MPDAQPSTADSVTLPQDLTGRILGDYELLRRLGTGGMGQVYLARQLSLKRNVAVKLLRNDLVSNPTALQRFQTEAEAVARLNHPNIVHIHQIGEDQGLRYMVLEYVEGRNLRDYLQRKGPPDPAVTLSIIRQVALALQKAHDQGIIHRDIKPENILVTRRVEVKVTDFGLSRFFSGPQPATHLTQSGVTVGTPLYMSPEQVQGHPIDQRTDIYSLGVTCYHLLAGEPPFHGNTAFEVALKHVQEQPRPLAEHRPDLPPALCALVHRMMAKNPNDRYQTAREVLRDLARVRDEMAGADKTPVRPGGGQALALTLTTSGPVVGPPRTESTSRSEPPGISIPTSVPSPIPNPKRRLLVGLLVLAGFGSAVFGALLAWWGTDPAVELPPSATPPVPAGLPDVRSPERIVVTRERELLAVLGDRSTGADDVLKASIELGLMYIRDQRFEEAQRRFERLEREEAARTPPLAARSMAMAGRLGQAVVLAYREPARDSKETPQSLAQASNDLILRVIQDASPKIGKPDKLDRGYQAVAAFLLRYPNLGQAVTEALNHNMLTLGRSPPLSPAVLENLRNLLKGTRKD
jgi:serine/threonine protein kinase